MATMETLERIIREKGWLAIASLYFDNSYEILIPRTGGCIAYSPDAECFFTRSTLDNDNSRVTKTTLLSLDKRNDLSPLTSITITGFDMLQHFDTSLYISPIKIFDCVEKGEPFPEPTYPSKQDLLEDSIVPDATLELLDGTVLDGKSMYEDRYSFARIDGWKMFYQNHANFIKFIESQYGYNDCI